MIKGGNQAHLRCETEESSIQLCISNSQINNDLLGETFQSDAKRFLDDSELKLADLIVPSLQPSTDRPSAIASERVYETGKSSDQKTATNKQVRVSRLQRSNDRKKNY